MSTKKPQSHSKNTKPTQPTQHHPNPHQTKLKELETCYHCTIHYKLSPNDHHKTATLTIPRNDNNLTISDVMCEIGQLLSLENDRTLDFRLHKEIPDSHPIPRADDLAGIINAPGSLIWIATCYQDNTW